MYRTRSRREPALGSAMARVVRTGLVRTGRVRTGRVRTGLGTLAMGIGAVLIVGAGVAFFAPPAFAWTNIVTGTAVCPSGQNQGITITWTVANDFNASEVATVTSATGGVGTVTGSPADIPASPGKPFKTATLTQVIPSTATGSATLTVKGVWSGKVTQTNSGTTPLPGGCPTQTLSGHIYLCPGGTSPTATEVPGGSLAASGPQNVASIANPLAPTHVIAGHYTMSATAPGAYQLVPCGGSSSVASGGQSASESVAVPAGGSGNGVFYATTTPVPRTAPASGAMPVASQSPPAPPAAPASSPVQGATTVTTGEPWAGSDPYVYAALASGTILFGGGLWSRRRRRVAPAHSGLGDLWVQPNTFGTLEENETFRG